MAAGEAAGASGRAWIAAAAVAYEVQCRLCDAGASGPAVGTTPPTGRSPRPSPASRLRTSAPRRLSHAMGIAGTTGTALRLTRAGELSMWKGCAFAYAARNGVFAAPRSRGADRPRPSLRGRHGVLPQVSGPLDLPEARRPSAADWMFQDVDQVRPGRVPQPVGDRRRIGTSPADRRPRADRSIEIATFDGGRDHRPGPEKWHPRTRETADHSLPYCAAVALVDGEARPPSSAPTDSPTRPCSTSSLEPSGRRSRPDRRLPGGNPQPGHGHAR